MEKINPGWNDPPPVSCQEKQDKPRSFLKQRIAFPLSSSDSPTAKKETLKAPPNTLPPSTSNSTPTKPIAEETTDPELFTKVLNILNSIVDTVTDSNKKADILKRIEVMKTMWENNELNPQIQNHIQLYVEHLRNGETEKANEIYSTLTMNSAAVCSSWIIAFKYILYYCKKP